MLVRALAILLIASPAMAQSYLVEPSLSDAQARSQQQCLARGCDGVQTVYWWRAITLTNGQGALVIAPSGDYGPAGLTASESAALQAASQIGSLLAPAPAIP